MKKLLFGLAVISMLMTCFTGCGGSNKSSNSNSEGYSTKMIRIGSASMGGNNYVMGNAIAQLINEKMHGVKASNQETDGSAANVNLLEDKDIEMALVMGATLQQAVEGGGKFKKEDAKNLALIGTIKFDTYHILVNKDAKINTIADLKGKSVGVGPMGGGPFINAKFLLDSYGISVSDIKPMYGTVADCYEQLKSGQIDALIHCASSGSSQPADAMTSGSVILLPIDSEHIEKMLKVNRSFSKFIIPANTYKNQDKDIETVASTSVLVCRSDLDKKLIYDFTKTFYENQKYLLTFHAVFSNAIAKNAPSGKVLDFHPGAAQYLKEIGVIK